MRIESIYYFNYANKIGYYDSFREYYSDEITFLGLMLSTPEVRINASPVEYKINQAGSAEIKAFLRGLLPMLKEVRKEEAVSSPEYILICYDEGPDRYFQHNPSICKAFEMAKRYRPKERKQYESPYLLSKDDEKPFIPYSNDDIYDKDFDFNKITEDLSNMLMSYIKELTLLLTSCGANSFIEQDKERFEIATCLFILFFQERSLHKQCCPKYKHEVSMVIDTMLCNIADRFDKEPRKTKELYLQVDKLTSDYKVIRQFGVFSGFAMQYFQLAFSGEYTADDDIRDKVGQFFKRIINEVDKYLLS